MPTRQTHSEGDLYKVITVAGHTFTIRYGYYTEEDRLSGEPTPVFPNFENEPLFSEQGHPLVTRIQDSCLHYRSHDGAGDGWCADCRMFENGQEDIGLCLCEARRRMPST